MSYNEHNSKTFELNWNGEYKHIFKCYIKIPSDKSTTESFGNIYPIQLAIIHIKSIHLHNSYYGNTCWIALRNYQYIKRDLIDQEQNILPY